MEKEEKSNNKTLTVILFILLIVSVVGNVVLSKSNSEVTDENTKLNEFVEYLEKNNYSYVDEYEGTKLYTKGTINVSINPSTYTIEIHTQNSDPMDLSYSISETEESDDIYNVTQYVLYDVIRDEYYIEVTGQDGTDLYIKHYLGENGNRVCYGKVCDDTNEDLYNRLNRYLEKTLEDYNFKNFATDSKIDFNNIF